MESPTDRQRAAFNRYWQSTFRIAMVGLMIWTIVERETIDPQVPLAAIFIVCFLDILWNAIGWINRSHAKRPPDAP